jgi:tRNA (Thr-GGU) A37 N-methylase
MALRGLSISSFVHYQWRWAKILLDFSTISKEDTVVCIFSLYQEGLNELLACTKIKILYVSPKAINKRPGHGIAPRNTLVVFELV